MAYTRTRTSISGASLTIITNRLGDIGLLVAVGGYLGGGIRLLVASGILLAALTKRAQFPFSAWLPAAIAAPTPVSALVHSRTLVTAGIFIVIRFAYATNSIVLTLGCLTIIVGGLAALNGQDAKKLVAFSTISQLGLIIFTVGAGRLQLALNHILRHAFFKSMLFIAIGVLIHTNYGRQESRLGGSACSNRNRCIIGILACLSISGLPYSSGFATKHVIMESFRVIGSRILLVGFVSGRLLTIVYRGKLLRILVGYSARLGSLGSARVDSSGESPLWFNLTGGILIMPCLGLTTHSPIAILPARPFIGLLFCVGLAYGVRLHSQMNSRMWFRLVGVGVSPAAVASLLPTVPVSDHVPNILARPVIHQISNNIRLGASLLFFFL